MRKYKLRIIVIPVIIIIIFLSHAISAVTLDRHIEYKEVPFNSSKISAEMDGYKIAFITDIHFMTVPELNDVVEKVNKLQPDLLIFGGDAPSSDGAPKRTMEVLAQVVTTDGIYGVEGNHDNYVDLFAAMENYSITPLSNNGVRIRENFYLAGTEDLWNRNPEIEKAVEGAQSDDFVLLIAHNPDVTMIQDTTFVDLILSGHTHGGQMNFFGIWAPALTLRKNVTNYGQRFMSGWANSRDGTPVYVSNGIGTFADVPRFFARPQVILFTLYADQTL